MNRKRVVVAGLGDAGVLAAIRLSRHADVVGISTKPALVSGQNSASGCPARTIGPAITGSRSTGFAAWIASARCRRR